MHSLEKLDIYPGHFINQSMIEALYGRFKKIGGRSKQQWNYLIAHQV